MLAIVTPSIPHDVINEILDHLATDPDSGHTLQSCSLVSKLWVESCRRYLFHTISFNLVDTIKWIEAFPVAEHSPARHVRELGLSLGGDYHVPDEFFRCLQTFTNVRKVTMSTKFGKGWWWIPSFSTLPRSVTSLTIETEWSTLQEIRDVMAQLPNLNDLKLAGFIHPIGSGMGSSLKANFGGRLQLHNLGRNYPGVVNMLLEVPTGLHFTEIEIHGEDECLASTVMLAEACAGTLVRLSCLVENHGGHEAFGRSFDFGKFPNLEKAEFTVHWVTGSLLWIPEALSTIKPATSPRLSVVQVIVCDYSSRYSHSRTRLDNDFRSINEEVSQIGREFEGAVDLTVGRSPRSSSAKPAAI